ncbi:MAG: hypothetical protein OH338_01345, partial [Candidatus Parvarchaeota archaeon]|nr:hypothetical protein [Candidatus Parvarchaeum tengchongense]
MEKTFFLSSSFENRGYGVNDNANELIKLNISFIKCVLTLYDEMMSNGISLVYLGEFNQQIITMFTS